VKLEERIAVDVQSGKIPPRRAELQGVSKDRLKDVLTRLDRAQNDTLDAVFALLDDTLPSFFTKAAKKFKFCHGASTAHIACHIGIIQRGKGKLDREGRDYWLKPLWEIGALDKVYFSSEDTAFLPGHPKAKSPNSAYRIETPWDNGGHFATGFKKEKAQPKESRVEVGRLNPGHPEGFSVLGIAAEFFVRRVEYGVRESAKRHLAKETVSSQLA